MDYKYLCLADMLYPAVISLAGCSSAEPASVSYSKVNLLKTDSVTNQYLKTLKEENARQRRY